MNLKEILDCRSCTELFPQDPAEAKKIYLDLVRRFHPDRCSDPESVRAMAVVNELYGRTRRSPAKSTVTLNAEGYSRKARYIREYSREDGIMYYSGDSLCYVLDSELNGVIRKVLSRRTDRRMPQEVVRQMAMALPKSTELMPLADGRSCVFISAESGERPLDEVLSFYGKAFDSRHAAWIISRLLGLCCFAELGGIVLNSICTENLLINPAQHTVRLAGGWWFSAREGEKMFGAQSEVCSAMPASCRSDGLARHITDLECVKAVCRKIFPDSAPEPLHEFADSACSANAAEELERWEETICRAFGGRFFTPMKICLNDIFTS